MSPVVLTDNYPEAERFYREALALKRATLGEDQPATLVTMSNLGWLLQLVGRLGAADSVLRQTLGARRRLLGDRHTSVGATLSGLGEVAHRRGAYAEAERYFSEAIAISRERRPGSSGLGNLVHRLAGTAAAQGRYDEARARYEEAIALIESTGGSESTLMARTLSNMGGFLVMTGDYEAAGAAYRRAWYLYPQARGRCSCVHSDRAG